MRDSNRDAELIIETSTISDFASTDESVNCIRVSQTLVYIDSLVSRHSHPTPSALDTIRYIFTDKIISAQSVSESVEKIPWKCKDVRSKIILTEVLAKQINSINLLGVNKSFSINKSARELKLIKASTKDLRLDKTAATIVA